MASYLHHAGTAGTVTVPAGRRVREFTCIGGDSGGTIVITPAGQSAQPTITVPADTPFSVVFDEVSPPLLAGTTIVFTGTASYYVRYAS